MIGETEEDLFQPQGSGAASQKLNFGGKFSQAKNGARERRVLWAKGIARVQKRGMTLALRHNGGHQIRPLGRQSRFQTGQYISFMWFKEEDSEPME